MGIDISYELGGVYWRFKSSVGMDYAGSRGADRRGRYWSALAVACLNGLSLGVLDRIGLDWTYVDETDRVLRPVVAFGQDRAVG